MKKNDALVEARVLTFGGKNKQINNNQNKTLVLFKRQRLGWVQEKTG